MAVLVGAAGSITLSAGGEHGFQILVAAVLAAAVATLYLYLHAEFQSVPLVLTLAIALRLILIPVGPVFSDDAYRYIWDGELVASGVDPYQKTPVEVARDSAVRPNSVELSQLNSPTYYSVYPPVAQLSFALAYRLSGGRFERAFLFLKLLFLFAELVAVLLLARWTTIRAFILYALNPAVFFAVGAQPHTEALVLPLILLAVVSTSSSQRWLPGVFIGLAVGTKLTPLVLVPSVVRRSGAPAVVASVVVLFVCALPFLHVHSAGNILQSLSLYYRLFEFNAGPYYLAKGIALLVSGVDLSKVIGPLFAITYVVVAANYFFKKDADRPIADSSVFLLGAFLVLSTTVHPWYFLPVLLLIALTDRPHWHWQWLSVTSVGTYLLYADGPYWLFVIVGWVGFGLLYGYSERKRIIQYLLRRRARRKADHLRRLISSSGIQASSLLDVGSAEGYVMNRYVARYGGTAHLIDVEDRNMTSLPYDVYDGVRLPYCDMQFDVAVLYFVAHHASDAKGVISECLRCARVVVVVESTFTTTYELRWLKRADNLANRLRMSGRTQRRDEIHQHRSEVPHFRTAAQWRELFGAMELNVLLEERWGGPLHRQVAFVVTSSSDA